jgi:hypothetical protein
VGKGKIAKIDHQLIPSEMKIRECLKHFPIWLLANQTKVCVASYPLCIHNKIFIMCEGITTS